MAGPPARVRRLLNLRFSSPPSWHSRGTGRRLRRRRRRPRLFRSRGGGLRSSPSGYRFGFGFVPWPSEGYPPYQLIHPAFSFSHAFPFGESVRVAWAGVAWRASHARAPAHAPMRSHMPAHTRSRLRTHARIRAHRRRHTRLRARPRARSRLQAQTRTCRHAHAREGTPRRAHLRAYAPARARRPEAACPPDS